MGRYHPISGISGDIGAILGDIGVISSSVKSVMCSVRPNSSCTGSVNFLSLIWSGHVGYVPLRYRSQRPISADSVASQCISHTSGLQYEGVTDSTKKGHRKLIMMAFSDSELVSLF